MSKPTGKLIRLTAGNVGAVPVGRKVNNKPLSADVSLSAGDVGAYGKTESDNKYQPKGNYAPAGNYAVKGDSYTKSESDGRYQPKGSYQPTGNYALKGDSYTKAESYNRTDIDKKIGAGSGFGYGQKWQNLASARTAGVTYTNTTSKPIMVVACKNGNGLIQITIDGVIAGQGEDWDSIYAVIPIGSTYKLTIVGKLTAWAELRE